MASSAGDTQTGGVLPAPWAFLGFVVAGGVAVVALPNVADSLPHPGSADQAQYATTSLGVVAIAAIYVYFASGARSALARGWAAPTLIYGAGLVIVKFILSPTAFEKSSGASLTEFITAGIAVVPIYIAALTYMYRLAARKQGQWQLSSRLVVAAGFGVAAVLARLLVAFVLGTASDYLEDFVWAGFVLPLVVGVGCLAVMHSFDRAGPSLKEAFYVGIGFAVVLHLLWVVYMWRLFS